MKTLGQPEESNKVTDNYEAVGDGRLLIVGAAIIVAFFGGFVVWAGLAPLDSAAIANGAVRIESSRKVIQHLEGGIIAEIKVRDGDIVVAGQTLVRLDDTQTRARLQLVQGRLVAALALEARLVAERDNAEIIQFPKELLDQAPKAEVRDVMRGQSNIFEARRRAITGQTAILRKRISILRREIQGRRAMVKAQDKMRSLAREEITDVAKLLRTGLTKKARLLALQSREAEIEGNRGENLATVAGAEQQIEETRLRINELGTAMINEIVQQLQDIQQEIFDLKERIRSAEDLLTRTEIKAQVSGTVVDLRYHTTGGVIGPGDAILDIVPSGDKLVIEARVDPKYIDIVRRGLAAHVTLTSFNMRRIQPVEGRVLSVSADRLTDDRSGVPYYLARVGLIGDVHKSLDGASLYPGMPADVMIKTEKRTALDYFFRPLTASFDKAFRED